MKKPKKWQVIQDLGNKVRLQDYAKAGYLLRFEEFCPLPTPS